MKASRGQCHCAHAPTPACSPLPATAKPLIPPCPLRPPPQALAAEVTANFGKRLEALGLSVRELTGDMQLSKKEMAETQVGAGRAARPLLLRRAPGTPDMVWN